MKSGCGTEGCGQWAWWGGGDLQSDRMILWIFSYLDDSVILYILIELYFLSHLLAFISLVEKSKRFTRLFHQIFFLQCCFCCDKLNIFNGF